jgi:hypothetical protein
LFSGGQIPPPTLHVLASFDGAFISLSTTTLMKRMEDEHLTMEPKRHQGPSTSETETGLCKVTFEYLRLIGVFNPICCLIYNMMDCVYGDLSSKDCYSSIDEVTLDLAPMSSNLTFLRGFSLDNIPSLVAQLNKIKIPRLQEFEDITACYRKFVEGSCELAIIESGSGKSWLSQNVERFIVAQGGIFLVGKFDQMQQSKPFSAIATAFDSFIDVMIRSRYELGWVNDIISNLQIAIGEDGHHLMNVIHTLSSIINGNASQITAASSLMNMNAQNSVQLLHHLFCRFVEVITANVQVSLTLCLDDIQWADSASIDLLIKYSCNRIGSSSSLAATVMMRWEVIIHSRRC